MRRFGVRTTVLAGLWLALGAVHAQSYTKTETITYHDNTAKWVLGQVERRLVNGVEVEKTTFDPSTAQPLTLSSFGKLQQRLTYHADGTVATVRDGRDNATTLSGWKRGVPQLIVFADDKRKSALVNDDGTLAWVTDENGYKTCYSYDAMGRLARVTYPSESTLGVCDTTSWNATTQAFQSVATSEYGLPAGHWRQTVGTGNGIRITYFDGLWRPVLVREYDASNVAATQRFTRHAYDHEGRVTFTSYPSAADNASTGTWTYYDALGRVTKVEQDSEWGRLVTTTSYLNNAAGYYTLVTDPKKNQTRTWYQAFDQPSYDAPVTIWHPEGAYTHISRDVFGKPTKIRRSDSSDPTGGAIAIDRTYTYNANQELCRVVEPETGASLRGYDAAGNLAWSATGLPAGTACNATGDTTAISARRAIRSYDARNRIATLSFPDNRGNTTHTYTDDGLPATITVNNDGGSSQIVSTTYSYNRRRLLGSERMNWNAIAWSLETDYNANGHIASKRYPAGDFLQYLPNALGQPTQVGSHASAITYHPNGAVKQFTYGNGIVHTLSQNARGLPDVSADAYGSTKFVSDGHDYDGNGNVAAITDGATGRNQRGNRTMSYDGLDRLTATASPMFGTATYSYDVLDNLAHVSVDGGTSPRDHYYCYDASWRLGNVKTGSCSGSTVIGLNYDLQGNLNNKNGTTFDFDYGNRLRSTSAGSTSYVYDALGRRVRDYTGASKYSLYSQDGQLMHVSDDRKKLNTSYVYLGGRLIAQVDRATVAPSATPALTTPASNSTGAFTASWTAVSTAERYELEQRKDGGAWAVVYNGINLSKAVSGLVAGSYDYRVRACNAAGCAAYSAIRTVLVTLPPSSAPTVSTPATNNTGAYTVGWTGVSSSTDYRLEQRKDEGAWGQIYLGTALSAMVSGLGNGSYEYRAQACNAAGCSAYSAIKSTVVTFPPGSAPTVTAPTTSNTGSFTINWTGVSMATEYRLEQRKDAGAWGQIYSGTALSKGVAGLSNGSYDYRGRACNAGGCGVYSAVQNTTVALPPGSAPVVTAPATSNTASFTISWTGVSTTTEYRLEQRKDAGAWSQIYSGTALSKAVSGLTNGNYDYRVRACNANGCSAYSAVKATAVALPPSSAPVLTVPATSSTGSFTLSWTSVSDATSYVLMQRKDGSGLDPWQILQTGTALSRAISGLVNGSYEYQVEACNAVGCKSSVIKVTLVTLPPASAPTVTAPTSDGDGAFTVSWTGVSTTTSYRLEQRKDGGAWSQVYSGTALSAALSGLTAGNYDYRARACNAGGCSMYSAIRPTVVAFAPSSAPALYTPGGVINSYGGTSYTVSWSVVSDASRYELDRSVDGGTWQNAYNSTGTSRSFTVFSGSSGSATYRVRACNVSGCGPYSGTKDVYWEHMGGCDPNSRICEQPR